ncbi:hypothetical protein [Pedobacter sp. CFBP9032]|uniref:hypothetical protein n=1 Tax=Pedobacter sp. CFBP9032 TaxID=3096539 RepID=UPI002A6B5626|nr:hypothetical protein [Pedobacter sp. CFBP9032]MDY0904435.1 hypothetical protein [Pedobacter sp. CFBP9032]
MKKLYIILFVFFISFQIKAQTLNGTYIHKSTSGSIKLSFRGDHFHQVNIDSNISRTEGSGAYELKDKNLTLFFGKTNESDTSRYELKLDKIRDPNTLGLKIIILDLENNSLPMNNAFCSLTNSEGSTILTNFSDALGKVNLMIYDLKPFETIMISSLGYQTVKIPISKIKGNIATIGVSLREVKKSDEDVNYVSNFVIKTSSNKEFVLKTKDGKELLFKWSNTPMLE